MKMVDYSFYMMLVCKRGLLITFTGACLGTVVFVQHPLSKSVDYVGRLLSGLISVSWSERLIFLEQVQYTEVILHNTR